MFEPLEKNFDPFFWRQLSRKSAEKGRRAKNKQMATVGPYIYLLQGQPLQAEYRLLLKIQASIKKWR